MKLFTARLLAAGFTTCALASAQDFFEPNLDEFTITDSTAFQQIWSKVATDEGGTFFAYAWSAGQDVYVRLFEPDGTTRTNGIRCNPNLDTYIQDEPAVSIDVNGNILVAWSDRNGYDGEIMGIFATLFDSQGNVLRGEFQVNQSWQASQWRPLIRPMPGGGFLVAWTGEWDGDSFFRVFNTSGFPVTGDVRVNIHQNGAQVDAAPAVAPDGTIFVAYVDFVSFGSVGTGTNVWGRLFNSAGQPLTTEFHLATGMADGDQREPRAIADDSGNFLVAWEDNTNDGGEWGIFARTFDLSGNPLSRVFQVNNTSAGRQRGPDVAVAGDGLFIVTWDDDKLGDDNVVAQRVDVTGTRSGAELEISDPSTAGNQYRASVCSTANRRTLAFGWDGDGNSVDAFGRIFTQTPLPTFYCTGKTTSQGLVPFLTYSGQPSARNKNSIPFRIQANNLVPGNHALLLYGYAKADLNFHGGKLCIKSPFEKALPPKQAAADGTMFRNFNNNIISGNDPMLTAGQVVTVQIRQSDGANTIGGYGDNLTNGMRFTITP